VKAYTVGRFVVLQFEDLAEARLHGRKLLNLEPGSKFYAVGPSDATEEELEEALRTAHEIATAIQTMKGRFQGLPPVNGTFVESPRKTKDVLPPEHKKQMELLRKLEASDK